VVGERGRRERRRRWRAKLQEAPGLPVREVEGTVGVEGQALGVDEVAGEVGEMRVRVELADG